MNNKTLFADPSFYKKALAIAIPVMLQALLQNLVSLIDNFMVAGLGDIKMSGVNIANQIIFVYFVALNTICSGGAIFMSQFNGAKDKEGMRQTFRYKLIVALALTSIIIALCVLLPQQLLKMLLTSNTESTPIIAEGTKYLRLIVWTMIPTSISLVIGTSLREIGKVKAPLVISVVATIVNTFFNWVFIYGNLGAPRLEVQGAAIATIIARLVEVTLFIIFIRRTKPGFYSRARDLFKVQAELFFSILRKTGLIFAAEMSWALTETVMTAVFNGRGGSEIVSGMAAGWAIANLFFLVFGGIHTSIGVIVGGTLGQNKLDRAREEARWLQNGGLVVGTLVAIIEAGSVFLIPLVFGNLSGSAQTITRNMLFVISCFMPFWVYLNAQFATARAGGDAIMGAWVDISVNATLLLPSIILLAMFTTLGPIEMFAIVKLTDLVKIGVAHWQLKTERWLKNLTIEHAQKLAVK